MQIKELRLGSSKLKGMKKINSSLMLMSFQLSSREMLSWVTATFTLPVSVVLIKDPVGKEHRPLCWSC